MFRNRGEEGGEGWVKLVNLGTRKVGHSVSTINKQAEELLHVTLLAKWNDLPL